MLRAHKARQSAERLAWGEGWGGIGHVFTREDGSPVDPGTVSDTFTRLCKSADVPVIRFHDLRHSAATIMLSAGVPARVAQELLGHANVTVTLQTYSHVLPGMSQDAGRKLSAAVFGPEVAKMLP